MESGKCRTGVERRYFSVCFPDVKRRTRLLSRVRRKGVARTCAKNAVLPSWTAGAGLVVRVTAMEPARLAQHHWTGQNFHGCSGGTWAPGRTGLTPFPCSRKRGWLPFGERSTCLVERFEAPPEVRATVEKNAERLALGIMDELGPTKAAIASVAQEFLRLGRSMADVSSHIAEVHPGIDSLKDLVIEVNPRHGGDIRVLVNGRVRPHSSHSAGLFRRLRIPLFASDCGGLVQFRDASLTRDGYDARRVQPRGPTQLVIKANDTSFELFKVLEKARLAGGLGERNNGVTTALRKYSITKLPLTDTLLREAGLINEVGAEYVKRFARKAANGRGRSPRKLAEEALQEACERVVPKSLSDLFVAKYS